MKVLHLGETLWDRATRELKLAGYLITVPVRDEGRWAGQDYIFDPLGQHTCELAADNPASPETDLPGAVGPGTAEPGAVGHPFNNTTSPTQHLEQKTTTTPRARGAANVVVSEEDQAKIVWPAGLTDDQISGMRGILLGNSWPGLADAQALLDELAGQLPLGKVKNPPGLLRRLLERQKEGTFTQELGPEVRRAREARAAAERREAEALAGKGEGKRPAGLAAPASGESEEVRRERERLRQKYPGAAERRAAKARL